MTTNPTSGKVPPYSQIPITFICRTSKVDKNKGFTDQVNKKQIVDNSGSMTLPEKVIKQGNIPPPSEEKYEIRPEEYASMAVVSFFNSHEPLKV